MKQNTNTNAPISPAVDKPKSGNGLKTAVAITSIVAVCSIILGIYAFIDSSNKKQEISNLQSQIENMTQTQKNGDTASNEITISEAEKLVSKYTSLINVSGVCPMQSDIELTESSKVAKATNYIVDKNTINPMTEDMRKYYTIDYDSMNSAYKELFGESLNIGKQDYEFNGYSPISLKYNASDNTFKAEYADGIGGCVGDTVHLTNVVWAQYTEKALNTIVDLTEIDLGIYSSYGKLGDNVGGIKVESYLYEFVDDGGYVLKEITKIR